MRQIEGRLNILKDSKGNLLIPTIVGYLKRRVDNESNVQKLRQNSN